MLNHDRGDGCREIFKYRRIGDRKSFRVADLPDAYRLVGAMGYGNVYRYIAMRPQIRLLAEHPDTGSVKRVLGALPFNGLIDALGASA